MSTVYDIRDRKGKGKIVAITALDYPTAQWCAAAGVDIVLVGDSLGNVAHGLKDTTGVTMEMMELATRAVARGLSGAETPPLLVADMPLSGMSEPVKSAERLMDAGAAAVKVECHSAGMNALRAVHEANISVMAHVGLMPQDIERLGGYKLQGKTPQAAHGIIECARAAEREGAFSCVIEKVPRLLGAEITRAVAIPTIGIGAGPDCDGQILVLYDILGIFREFRPKFARRYAEMGKEAVDAITRYGEDVRDGRFPGAGESY